MTTLARGANYQIDLLGGIALHKVVPLPEASLSEGAASAAEMFTLHDELTRRDDVKGLVLDLREITSTPGPRTQASVAEALIIWEQRARRVAIVPPEGHRVLQLQMERLLTTQAPTMGRLLTTVAEGKLWVMGGDPEPLASGIRYR